MPSRRRRAQASYSSLIWPHTAETVDLEIAAWSPSASARAASTSRTDRPRTNEAITSDSSAFVLVTCAPNSRDANASVVPRSFGRDRVHRPGGRLDGHLPVPVTGAGAGIVAGRGPLVAVAAEELGDLRLQRGLHQQLRAKPGDVLQDLRQSSCPERIARRCGLDTVGRGYSVCHGRGSFPSMTWRS